MSLRVRVALVMALGVALALLLQGALGYLTFTRLVTLDVDRDLSEFTREVSDAVTRASTLDGLQFTHAGYVVHARLLRNGQVLHNFSDFPAELPPQRVQPGTHTVGIWRVTQATLGWRRQPVVLQTALTSPEFTSGLRHHRNTMYFSALTVTLLGFAAAYALAGYALRPLRTLTRVSRRIAQSGHLHEPMPVGRGSGEIHDLSVTFNQMLGRLAEFRSREATFNRQAAHELRTPLTAMRLSLDAAQGGYADPEETLDILDQELRRMQRLTNSILILAREGRLAETQPVDLAALARACAEAAGATYQGLPSATLRGDAALLRRALENLLENAARHAPGAPVTVSTQRVQRGLLLTVQDHGPGLPEDALPRLAEEFYRAASLRPPGPPPGERGPLNASTGLGLSVVRHVMTAHNGQLTFENVAPHGLKVTLIFPDSPNPPGAAP